MWGQKGRDIANTKHSICRNFADGVDSMGWRSGVPALEQGPALSPAA